MEYDGFVGQTELTSSQRARIYMQETDNFVLWNHGQNKGISTDAVYEAGEGAKEEIPTRGWFDS